MRNSLCATIIALLSCLMFAAVVLPAVAPPPISEVLAWGYFDGIDTPWHLPNGGTFTFRGWVQDKGYIVSTDTEVFPDGVITLSRLQDFRFILLNSWLLTDPASSIYVDTVVE